jgi:hypothetical protein
MRHAQQRLEERHGFIHPNGVPVQIWELENKILKGEFITVRQCEQPERRVYEVVFNDARIRVVWNTAIKKILTVFPEGDDFIHSAHDARYQKKKQQKKSFFRDLRRNGAEDCDDIEFDEQAASAAQVA